MAELLTDLFLSDFVLDSSLKDIQPSIRFKQFNTIINRIEDFAKIFNASIYINKITLLDVLIRYSKDIYGFSRLLQKTKGLGDLTDFIKNSSGLTVESAEPHLNKKVAYLAYHLSQLKPFLLLDLQKEKYPNDYNYTVMQKYFNECIILYIIKIILQENNHVIHIVDINYFLHCLKYRGLNRSSLELLFESLLQEER